jgi:hypothetical protein
MRKRAVAVALSGLLLMAGCTSDDGDGGADSPEASESPASQGSSGSPNNPTVVFGDSHGFEDGVAIKVSKPEQFRPSQRATTGGEPDYVRFNVRLTNGTKKRLSTAQVSVTVESGDGQAGDVIDPAKGLPGPPSKKIAPGGSFAWPLAFGVLDPSDVTVAVQVGQEKELVNFAS